MELGIVKVYCFGHKRGREGKTKFASEYCDSSSLKKRCLVRKADDETSDRALQLWFVEVQSFLTYARSVSQGVRNSEGLLYHQCCVSQCKGYQFITV